MKYIRPNWFMLLCCVLAALSGFGQYQVSGFVENKGQILDQFGKTNSEVIAVHSGNGLDMHLSTHGFSYQLVQCSKTTFSEEHQQSIPAEYKFHRIDIRFDGMNENAWIEWKGKSKEFDNFIRSNDEGLKEIYDVHHYSSIVYHNIYDGVDVEFFIQPNGNETSSVKFNFILEKGSDLYKIHLLYLGADNMSVQNDRGEFQSSNILQTSLGSLTESVPYSFFLIDGKEVPVEIGYVFDGKNIRFNFKNDPSQLLDKKLVVDPAPTITWSTYFGGAGADQGIATALDGIGNVYFGGITASSAGIATVGAYQTVYSGSPFNDVFVSKFDYTGTRIWSTYFGGTGDDQLIDMVADGAGNIYFCGSAVSTNLGTVGVYQNTNAGNSDAILVKFDTAGALQWCSYFGGGLNDVARGMGMNGNQITIGGQTASTSGVASAGAHLTAFAGAGDAFIAQFSNTGALNWSTYYGGANADLINGVDVNAAGEIYVAGTTGSAAGIATVGASQTALAGVNDGFLAKFDAMGSRIWATYMGGTLNDLTTSVSADLTGQVLISGLSYSNAGIATAGAYDTTLGGSNDGFITVYNSAGVKQWATYVGGTSQDNAYFCCFDAVGNIYMCGNTTSSVGLVTANAAQLVFGGGTSDAFVGQFTGAGVVQWITYHGGNGDDFTRSLSIDIVNGAFMAGLTTSSSGISTAASYQPSLASPSVNDAFFVQYNNFLLLPISLIEFDAILDQSETSVICSWTSGSDEVCHHYVLDKSTDTQNWERITELNCDASQDGIHYEIIDELPYNGVSYYKLTQQDETDQLIDSRISSVYIGDNNELKIFPVPAFDQINVLLPSSFLGNAHFEIFDTESRLLFTYQISSNKKKGLISLDIQTLDPGVYVARFVSDNGNFYVKRFIKN